MKNIVKSLKTTVIGTLILAYVIYNAFWLNKEIDFNSILGILVSVGFLFTKDANKTHSMTVDPDREYPDERG